VLSDLNLPVASFKMSNLAHVFYDYNLAFISTFAVLELWFIQR